MKAATIVACCSFGFKTPVLTSLHPLFIVFIVIRKLTLFILLTALLFPAISQAGIKNNRFNQRNNVLQDKRMPKQNATLGNQRASLGNQTWNGNKTFNKQSSSLLNQRAPIAITESRQKEMFNAKRNQQLQDKTYNHRGKQGLFNKLAAMNEQSWNDDGNINSRFTRNDVIYLQELDNFGRRKTSKETELSMQDFNRFAFRKNRSSDAGINSERAGSEEPEKTVRASSTVKE